MNSGEKQIKNHCFTSKDYFCKKITLVNYLSVENISKTLDDIDKILNE
jgi:hypothetical protein